MMCIIYPGVVMAKKAVCVVLPKQFRVLKNKKARKTDRVKCKFDVKSICRCKKFGYNLYIFFSQKVFFAVDFIISALEL